MGRGRKPARRVESNHEFVADAAPGCHLSTRLAALAPWVLGSSLYDPDDFEEGVALPDLAFAGDTKELTAVNTTAAARVFYVSTPHDCVGRLGPLALGTSRDEAGATTPCTTLIVLVPPATLLRLCRLQLPKRAVLVVDSDVSAWIPAPVSSSLLDVAALPCYSFPLEGAGPFLCTQGWGGALTHFMSASTWHALDFRVSVGTPLRSLAAGTVASVRVGTRCSGIHVSNLFSWNSVIVAHDDGFYAEFVHIASACVVTGQRVAAGEQIGTSGEAGFAPEPHLHLQARARASRLLFQLKPTHVFYADVQVQASMDPAAPTVPFALRGGNGGAFVPTAGRWYDATDGARHV